MYTTIENLRERGDPNQKKGKKEKEIERWWSRARRWVHGERHRGRERRRNQKVLENNFADPKPWQNGKQRMHGVGTGERGKSATIRGKSATTNKVIVFVFVFFLFVFKSGNWI